MNSPSRDVLSKTSALLTEAGFRHGFFTRKGGTSSPPFDSLNTSFVVGDDASAVRANLDLIARSLGLEAPRLFFPKQVHGDRHLSIGNNDSSERIAECEGDSLETKEPGIGVAVRTADCVPILFGCRKTGIVAATHSGWRGNEQNIAGKAAAALIANGASDLVAAIGPHIEQGSFEVSAEVAERLLAISPSPAVVEWRDPRPHVNLRLLTRLQLREAGIPDENIDDVPGCTFSDPENYFSFRRDAERAGRLLSAIVSRAR